MAQAMDCDGPLAGYLVAAQTVGSIFTIFLWLWLLTGLRVLGVA